MLGLDNAGKTTILYKLKLGEVVTTLPTIGGFDRLSWVRSNTQRYGPSRLQRRNRRIQEYLL